MRIKNNRTITFIFTINLKISQNIYSNYIYHHRLLDDKKALVQLAYINFYYSFILWVVVALLEFSNKNIIMGKYIFNTFFCLNI